MELSADQSHALAAVHHWLRDPTRRTLTLGGYAGTGKTTIIARLLASVGGAAVCAFTGKAAQVLRQKGVLDAQTLHRLIYQPGTICKTCDRWIDMCNLENDRRAELGQKDMCPQTERAVRFRRIPFLDHSLVVVDEASMLNTKLTRDLESFNVNVLYVGDHGQLEPIGDDPGLMHAPEVRLEQIHRQAAGSEVIQFAHHLRQHGEPSAWRSGGSVRIAQGIPANLEDFDMVLCGFNKTRVAVNRRIRKRRGYTGEIPVKGERVICLRNDHELGIFNGMLATVTQVQEVDERLLLDLVDDVGNEFAGLAVAREQFDSEKTLKNLSRDGPALFDFGYCLTVHKSQGSEWGKVAVLEQIGSSWNAARWRYTAATRAARELVWCLR